MKRIAFLFVCLGMLVFPQHPAALMPTDEKLRTAESENFIYIYQASLEQQIPKLARDCEDAHALLTPIFQWTPRNKPIVLFSDGYDIHNGWATVFPRATMMIYAADTPPGSTIYEPGDYIRRTVFHEYTHLLSMDPQFGLDGVLSRVFGRVLPEAGDPLSLLITFFALPPGAVAPVWFIEGLAMWTETEMVGPGRGRNTIVDMFFRSATVEDRLLTPMLWDLRTPEWPYGTAAYIYGMKTVQYAHETWGAGEEERNVTGELSLAVADSFPFFFGGRAWSITGKTFSELAWESIAHERSRQEERIRILSTQRFTMLERLTPDNIQVFNPRFDNTGEVVLFSGAPEEERAALYSYNLSTSRKPLHRLGRARASGSFSHISPAADRSHFYYTRLDSPRREKLVSQLYRFDPERNRARKITGKGRYRFPAISPDHSTLAAIRAEAGRQVLLQVPLEKAGSRSHEHILVTAPPGTTLVDPVYSPDHGSIVYIRADEASSQLRHLSLVSGEDAVLVEWSAIITSPVFHPEGLELVFVSDKNGVYNLYRLSLETDARPAPITHALGGVFQPDFSPDGRRIAVSAYDAHGYYLSVLDYNELTRNGPNDLPAIEPTWTPLEINEKTRLAVEARQSVPEKAETRKYRPYRAIRPNYWTPWLDASTDGAQGGLFFSFSDPVERHRLRVLGGYESAHGTPLASVVYSYGRFEPIFSLYGFHTQTHYTDLLEDTNENLYDYDEETGGLGTLVTFPVTRVDRSLYFSLGYQWSRTRSIRDATDALAGVDLAPAPPLFTGEAGAAWVNLEYLSGTAFRRSHSVEDGRYLSLALERTDDALGGDLNRTRFLGGWHEYITLPWDSNHVLKLEGRYGDSHGDHTAQGAFGLGGFSDTILQSTPGMPRSLGLRGYDQNTQVGTGIVKAGAAYRFPIVRFYRNINTSSPLYLHQVTGEIFYEGGRTTGSRVSRQAGNDWINAHGIEVNLGLTLLRWIDIAPGIGVVYAFDRERDETNDGDDGRLQVYISLKSVVSF